MEGAEGAEAAATAIGAAGGGIMGMIMGSIAGIMIFSLLNMLLEAFTGQSIGKMILKIKNANADGTAASMGGLLTRALLKYGQIVLSILAGIVGVGMLAAVGQIWGLVIFIGCFFVLGAKRQAIHDLIAKTAVFKKSDIK